MAKATADTTDAVFQHWAHRSVYRVHWLALAVLAGYFGIAAALAELGGSADLLVAVVLLTILVCRPRFGPPSPTSTRLGIGVVCLAPIVTVCVTAIASQDAVARCLRAFASQSELHMFAQLTGGCIHATHPVPFRRLFLSAALGICLTAAAFVQAVFASGSSLEDGRSVLVSSSLGIPFVLGMVGMRMIETKVLKPLWWQVSQQRDVSPPQPASSSEAAALPPTASNGPEPSTFAGRGPEGVAQQQPLSAQTQTTTVPDIIASISAYQSFRSFSRVSVLGRGQSSTVYLLRSSVSGREVAAKEIDTEGRTSLELDRIRTEVDLMSSLDPLTSRLLFPGPVLVIVQEYASRGTPQLRFC